MEEQGLQPPTETIDGNMKEEAEYEKPEVEEKAAETSRDEEDEEEEEERDEEEFYEKIEAPKFVDFTKPDPFRPDDRYWFCSRVGCDQKHEEEVDPEEISKSFVLRVLAARSPNIKLQKALNGKNSSIKCPLSAPAKTSKSRIPRLAMVSSISHKVGDPKGEVRPPPEVSCTPKAKSRQVAAKYMTTPGKKRCLPDPNSFRSVQNPKPTTVHVHKNRNVAKALVFHSPKKAISLKKSVELHTPLRKICEGLKRLEINSQKKVSKDIRSNPKKTSTEDPSRRHLRVCKGEKRSKDLLPPQSCPRQKPESFKSTKVHNKNVLNEAVEHESRTDDIKLREGYTLDTSKIGGNDNEKECLPLDSTMKEATLSSMEPPSSGNSDALLSDASRGEMNSSPNIEDKENFQNTEDHSSEIAGHESREMDGDDKENALNSEENNNREITGNKNQKMKILGNQETLKKTKVVRPVDKNLKGGLTANGAGSTVVNYKKPKPTNVKPFRLRTDERGILKEATLERKLHFPAPRKEATKDTSDIIKRPHHIQRNEKRSTKQTKCKDDTIPECQSESSGLVKVCRTTDRKFSKRQVESKLATQRRSESTQRRPKSMTSPLGSTENTSRTRSPYLCRQPEGSPALGKVMRPGQQLSVIKEKSSKATKQCKEVSKLDDSHVIVAENKTRAVCASRSTSRGKRPVTIAKEPNFHSSHLPECCTKKTAA